MVSPSSQPTHAIVIGASVAGLAAARVLTEHFDRVTILEKDELRDDATLRRGVPQARHVHALMIGGQRVLDSLLPGFSAWMLDQGAVAANVGRDGAWHLMGAFRPKYASALEPLCASRPLLEQGIRRFALQHERITLRGGVALAGHLVGRVLNAYVDRVQRGSLSSPALCEALYRVAQMLDAPTALFRPAVVWGVIRASMKPTPQGVALPVTAAQNPA